MKKFLKYNLNPKIDEKNNQQARIEISSLERGMGKTLGNALRRTLLFDIPGSSLFAIKINDATHEFQAIEGIKEDIVQIILNLKGLVIKIDENAYSDEDLAKFNIENWPVMEVTASGKTVVHASDIKLPVGFEIINKDLYICELTSSTAKLDLKLYATRDRGFTPFTENREKVNTLNVIAIDANFSPIVRVSYTVDEIKLSKTKLGDKLIFDLSTNGSISPSDAFAYAAKILSEYLQPLIAINEKISELKLIEEEVAAKKSQTLSIQIEDMNLSVRSFNCLKRAGIQTIQQLTDKTKDQVEHIKNLGKKSLREIQKKLVEYGLSFKQESSNDANDEELNEEENIEE